MCLICGDGHDSFVGKRPGHLDRATLGVECNFCVCRKCDLVFSGSRPVPARGLGKHFDGNTDESLKDHISDGAAASRHEMFQTLEQLVGGKWGRLTVGVSQRSRTKYVQGDGIRTRRSAP